MKKIPIIFVILFLILSLTSCFEKQKLTKEMLESKDFSATEASKTTYLCHLTMNEDKTYDYYYEYVYDGSDPIYISNTWQHVLSFSYNYYSYFEITNIKQKNKDEISIYKLNECFNDQNKQLYFVYGSIPYVLFATNEIITKDYILTYRTDYDTKNEGYISLPGIELYKRGSVSAEWK